MDGVEFLPPEDSDDGRGEQLDTGRPGRVQSPWMTMTARVAIIAVALAALAVWVTTRPSGPTAPAAAQATVTAPSPSRPSTSGIVLTTCTRAAPIPNQITDAMHRFLKGIVINNLDAVRCVRGTKSHYRVASESITGTYRHVRIDVSVSLRDADFPVAFDSLPARGTRLTPIGTVETESAGVKVQVIAAGNGARLSMNQVQRLADFISLNTVL